MLITTAAAKKAGLTSSASILLQQVGYWWPKAKVEFGGRKFIAKTREGWCEETGLTLDQYKDALSVLKKAGYVETEQHKWGGRSVTFLALLKLPQVVAKRAVNSRKSTTQVEVNAVTQVEASDTTLIEQRLLSETTIKGPTKACDTPNSKFTKTTEEKQRRGSVPLSAFLSLPRKEVPPMAKTSAAVLAGILRQKQEDTRADWKSIKPDPTQKATPTDLFTIWKKGVGELGLYAGVMSGRDRGIFQHLCKTAPPGTAPTILSSVLQDWSAFKAFLEGDYKAFKVPNVPDTGTLYRYADQAVTWWMREQDRAQSPNDLDAAFPAVLAGPAAPDGFSDALPVPAPCAPVAASKGPPGAMTEEDRFEVLVEMDGFEAARTQWLSLHPALPGKFNEVTSC